MVIANFSTMRLVFATTSTRGVDGYEIWPVENLLINGFDDGFTGLPVPLTDLPITLSVDGSADGAEAYHAYLSQRTDDTSKQYLSLSLASGKSGTWDISATSLLTDAYGAGPYTSDQIRDIFRYCTLYVQRISDQSIQFLNILETTLAAMGES